MWKQKAYSSFCNPRILITLILFCGKSLSHSSYLHSLPTYALLYPEPHPMPDTHGMLSGMLFLQLVFVVKADTIAILNAIKGIYFCMSKILGLPVLSIRLWA